MNKQSCLITLKDKNFKNIILCTYKNKGKVYPYMSERQKNRNKK